MHKKQYTFVSGASDNIKKWQFPEGKFMQNLSGEEQRGTERDEEDNHNCVLCAVCGVRCAVTKHERLSFSGRSVLS